MILCEICMHTLLPDGKMLLYSVHERVSVSIFYFTLFIENIIITLRICMHNHNATQLLWFYLTNKMLNAKLEPNKTQHNITFQRTFKQKEFTNQPYCAHETFVWLFSFDAIISAGWEALYGKWVWQCGYHWNLVIFAPQNFSWVNLRIVCIKTSTISLVHVILWI